MFICHWYAGVSLQALVLQKFWCWLFFNLTILFENCSHVLSSKERSGDFSINFCCLCCRTRDVVLDSDAKESGLDSKCFRHRTRKVTKMADGSISDSRYLCPNHKNQKTMVKLTAVGIVKIHSETQMCLWELGHGSPISIQMSLKHCGSTKSEPKLKFQVPGGQLCGEMVVSLPVLFNCFESLGPFRWTPTPLIHPHSNFEPTYLGLWVVCRYSIILQGRWFSNFVVCD